MTLADIVITTALIPGRTAPVLVTEDMVKAMKPGSVIVDMAAAQGGNCPLTEAGKTVVKHGVHDRRRDQPAGAGAGRRHRAVRAQRARLPQAGHRQGRHTCTIDLEDDIVAACLMCRGGEIVRKNA